MWAKNTSSRIPTIKNRRKNRGVAMRKRAKKKAADKYISAAPDNNHVNGVLPSRKL